LTFVHSKRREAGEVVVVGGVIVVRVREIVEERIVVGVREMLVEGVGIVVR
jgi:hypothetical protein